MAPRRGSALAPWLAVAGVAHVALLMLGLVGMSLASPSRGTDGSPVPLASPATSTDQAIAIELLAPDEAAPGLGELAGEAVPPEAQALAPAYHRERASPSHDRVARAAGVSAAARLTVRAAPRDAADAQPLEAGRAPAVVEDPGASAPGAAQDLEQAPDGARRLSLQELGVGRGNNPFIGSVAELPTSRQLDDQRLRQSLRGELARRDQMHGLGPEGPAVQAVKDIVLASASAPNTSALLGLRTDATGAVTLVEVLESDRDGDEWRRIADQLMRTLTGKRLRVPARSNGVSFQLRVISRVQLPSGADPGLGVDLFGIAVKKGKGDKSAKLSVLTPTLQEVVIPGSDGQTMLVPTLAILGMGGDISDIGRVARRLVTAYLVGLEADVPDEAPALQPAMKPAAPIQP